VASRNRTARNKKKQPKVQKTRLEKLGFEKANITAGELRRALKKGQEYGDLGEWEKALPYLLKAWDAMPEDLNLLTLLSQGLLQVGVRDKAIAVLERTLAIHGETVEICAIMVNLALEMGMPEVAAKVSRRLIEMEPENPIRYVNLATAYTGMKELDTSIEMLQSVLPIFPDSADLWNVLATQVRARDGVEASSVFFEEAMRLGPNDFKIFSNYGQSLLMIGEYERALEVDMRAIELNPKSPEPRIGAAQLLFYKGAFPEAFENYEYRLDNRRSLNQVILYTHQQQRWQGEDLEGKSLLVTSEQGIGDEVMWGNYLPFLYERAEKLYIGCNYRLVDIYKRRFPNAHVEKHIDQIHQGYRYRSYPLVQQLIKDGEVEIDYSVPVASSPAYAWQTLDDVKPHPEGFLVPDSERANQMRERLAAISDKPKVALAWRSGVMTVDRAYIYASIEAMGPLMELKDKVDFINVQYGEVSEELALAEKMYGIKIHDFEDVDLKMDIEANLAIMDACDLVISSASAPGQFAIAVGAPTILMSAPKQWWAFGGTDKPGFAKDCELIIGGEITDWNDIMTRVRDRAVDKLSL